MAKTELKVFLTEEQALKFFRVAYAQNKSASKLLQELISDYLENTNLPKDPEPSYERKRHLLYTEVVRCWIDKKVKDKLSKRARKELTEVSKLVRDMVKFYLANQISV
jgi:hypothetical protein